MRPPLLLLALPLACRLSCGEEPPPPEPTPEPAATALLPDRTDTAPPAAPEGFARFDAAAGVSPRSRILLNKEGEEVRWRRGGLALSPGTWHVDAEVRGRRHVGDFEAKAGEELDLVCGPERCLVMGGEGGSVALTAQPGAQEPTP